MPGRGKEGRMALPDSMRRLGTSAFDPQVDPLSKSKILTTTTRLVGAGGQLKFAQQSDLPRVTISLGRLQFWIVRR